MNELSLRVADQTSFEPGDLVKVEAKWSLDHPPEALELRLVWNTAGFGDVDLQVVDTIRIENPPAGDTRQLTLKLPRQPYSFSGQLVSLTWALELVALPSMASTRLEIVIGPSGKPVLLPGLGRPQDA